MMERIVVALIMVAAVTSRADAQPAPAPQMEPPPAAAIPLAPPSMVAPRDPATSPPAASSQWYGWQILISDAAVFSFAGLTRNSSVAYGWVGGGAIVHLGHGNVGRGLASAALRTGLPLIGLYLGAASARGCQGDWCDLGEVVAGGAIGMLSAELIDVALLAHDSVPTPATVRAAQHSHGVEVSPVVRAGRSGFGLDLVGRF
jgi:hypothetical protein